MSNYEKYLNKLQSQKNTSGIFLDGIIRKVTKSTPLNKKRIIAGEINEVYEVKLNNNQEIILRVSHNISRGGFYQERWAFQKCRELDIPCPEIISIEEVEFQNQKLLLSFETKLPGQPLSIGPQIQQIPSSDLKKIITEAGNILSKIHSVHISGFGHLNPLGQGKFPDFISLISKKTKDPSVFFKLSENTRLSNKNIETIISLINKKISTIGKVDSFMVHGDFGPKHIMFQNNKITGIIDFEDVLGHSPVFDLARWEYFYGNGDLYKWLLQGYENKKLLNQSDYSNLFYLIQLDMGLDTLAWYCSQQYETGILENSHKLQKIISKFS